MLPYLAYTQPELFSAWAPAKSIPQDVTKDAATEAANEANQPMPVAADKVPTNAHPSLINMAGSEDRPKTPFFFDRVWNPGPVAAAHQTWENDCQACHTGNFSRVEDKSCTSCHGKMGLHVAQASQNDVNYEEPRCATCHRDHKGRESLAEQNRHFTGIECSTCHQDIKKAAPKTETENVADFSGNKHPPFRLTVAKVKDGAMHVSSSNQGHWNKAVPKTNDSKATTAANITQAAEFRRVRMNAGKANSPGAADSITEANSLKFPHDVHLSKNGVESRTEKKVLQCAACHTPADTPSGFEPIVMEKHCQECHSLAFEPALPDREVPHGAAHLALDTIAEFYGFLKQNPDLQGRLGQGRAQVLTRPGKDKEDRPVIYPAMSGNPIVQANFAAKQLFEKNACAVCHEVWQTNKPGTLLSPGAKLNQYSIAAVTPAHTWMPMAQFDHKAHEFESCTSCHAAPQSKKSKDVLMPNLESCQTCHAGSKPEKNKVQSDCGLCHGYHIHDQKPEATDSNKANKATAPSPTKTEKNKTDKNTNPVNKVRADAAVPPTNHKNSLTEISRVNP
ncbi:MAG: cytochrome c3 family protein [Limnobacter sp.]|nr:cytochrome c3 family protein [Limnobacter sp.]